MNCKRLSDFVYSFGCITLILIGYTHAQTDDDHSPRWTDWTPCNADCGTGVSSRTRPCSSRSNQDCQNEEIQYKVCNTQKCQNGEQNLKEKQCASHNNDKVGSRKYSWQPYSIDDSSCMLTCSAVGFGFYKTFSAMTNGTLCRGDGDGTSVCIEGKCKKFGCDDVIDSKVKKDSCGVCGGDDTTCQIIDDIFAESKLDYGYNKIGKIPAGARNINITQLGRSRNYLALKESQGNYFLNGNRRLSRDGKISGAGARFHYHRRHHRRCPGECVISKGPTTTDLDIMVLAFSHNPGIFYQYSLPSDTESEESKASGSDGSSASLSQYEAIIVEDDFKGPKSVSSNDTSSVESSSSQEVSQNEDLEKSEEEEENDVVQTAYNVTVDSDGKMKVSRTVRKQNNGRAGPQPPSPSGSKQMPGYTQSFRFIDRMLNKKKQANMKKGLNPKLSDKDRSYTVQADKVRQNGNTYDSSRNQIPNAGSNRGYKWEVTGYTPCSKPCGTGMKTPFVECYFNRRRVSDSHCRNVIKPSLDPISCNLQPCRGMWKASDWSPCSVTCGQGTQKRNLTCVYQMTSVMYAEADERDCNGIPKPETTQVCTINTCNQWQADDWGSCSVSCGTGRKVRRIMCKSNEGRRVRDESCDPMDMPAKESDCDMGSCEKTTSFFVSMRAWYYTEWPDTCPAECGSGEQVRKVLCLGDDINTDPSKSCTAASRPESTRECKSRKRCQPEWFTGAWSKCNTTCGDGYQLRDVVCVRKSGTYGFDIVPDYLCSREKPEAEEKCIDLPDCPAEWYMSDWGKCSVTCGTGRKARDIMCIDSSGRKSTACTQNTKPTAIEECRNLPCRFETRNSLPIDRAVSDKYRSTSRYSNRPNTRTSSRSRSRQRQRASRVRQQRRTETRSQTQVPTGSCRDQYSRCDTIVKRNLCGHPYYRRLCCISCKT